MTFTPGMRVRWQGQPAQIVDSEDPKLRPNQRFDRPVLSGPLRLIVAHNGQLVWVREADLRDDDTGPEVDRILEGYGHGV